MFIYLFIHLLLNVYFPPLPVINWDYGWFHSGLINALGSSCVWVTDPSNNNYPEISAVVNLSIFSPQISTSIFVISVKMEEFLNLPSHCPEQLKYSYYTENTIKLDATSFFFFKNATYPAQRTTSYIHILLLWTFLGTFSEIVIYVAFIWGNVLKFGMQIQRSSFPEHKIKESDKQLLPYLT